MKKLVDIPAPRVRVPLRPDLNEDPPTQGAAFKVKSPVSGHLRVIATSSDGWDHVSISHKSRIPLWKEMEFIKRMFFHPDEVAFQLHVPPAKHINYHANCLHLWRPHDQPIPLPPIEMV